MYRLNDLWSPPGINFRLKAEEPPETGREAALQVVLRAAAVTGPAAGDRCLANLILGDVTAIGGVGYSLSCRSDLV